MIDPKVAELHQRRSTRLLEWWNRLLRLDQHAAFIVLGAFLDVSLEELIKVWLLPGTFTDELLGDARGLGSFAQKTRLARSLDLIDDQAFKTLSIINKIRNHAAHSIEEPKLDCSPISDFIDDLPGFEQPEEWRKNRRKKLLMAAEWCSSYLQIRSSYLAGYRSGKGEKGDMMGHKQTIRMTVDALNERHQRRESEDSPKSDG